MLVLEVARSLEETACEPGCTKLTRWSISEWMIAYSELRLQDQ
jgi:hypothetical protein